MSAYLICEDGPQTGAIISFKEGDEWILGRDPDVCFFVLEDPMVSRRHALIRLVDGEYYIENLSTVNPTLVNENPLEESHRLEEDDIIQMGNSYFRYTKHPHEELHLEGMEDEEAEEITPTPSPLEMHLPFRQDSDSRWMIKVISGPNQGAEFGMHVGESYVLGKDASASDIVFQDLSVSRQHAKITFTPSGEVLIEDLNSRNGILVNGVKVENSQLLKSQDLISLGTTSFLLIDREQSRETIYSPAGYPAFERKAEEVVKEEPVEEKVPEPVNIKEIFIPTKHLVLAAICALALFVGVVGILALFKGQTIVVDRFDETKAIKETLVTFPGVQFSYNPSCGKLFLTGHVITDTDHSELLYLISCHTFITCTEDNVVVDEKVFDQMNALLLKNPNWRGVLVTATQPGRFVVRGYIGTEEEFVKLQEYLNAFFPYLNLLDNQVVVENTLSIQIQKMLIDRGFNNVTFQFNNGELVFAGRASSPDEGKFNAFLETVREINGIRQVRNFILFSAESTASIDLSSKYNVTGNSLFGDVSQYVLVNGRILSTGDTLDGMTITSITTNRIELEKDGIKYKIDYNLQ